MKPAALFSLSTDIVFYGHAPLIKAISYGLLSIITRRETCDRVETWIKTVPYDGAESKDNL
jgi:hypothetical protein